MRMLDEELNRTKHTQRKNLRTSSNDSQAQQSELTSRGGVVGKSVYQQRPHDMSITTNTTQPQELALCSRCHPAWASAAPQWFPARTLTVHWGPNNEEAVDGPTPTTQTRRQDAMTHHPSTPKQQSSDKQRRLIFFKEMLSEIVKQPCPPKADFEHPRKRKNK